MGMFQRHVHVQGAHGLGREHVGHMCELQLRPGVAYPQRTEKSMFFWMGHLCWLWCLISGKKIGLELVETKETTKIRPN